MYRIFSAILLFSVLTGCSTITLKVCPENAHVTVAGENSDGTGAVHTIRRPVFFDTSVCINMEGYAAQHVMLTRKTLPELSITLQRKFTLNTTPDGALVTGDDGRSWGTTPCAVYLPANAPTAHFLISKNGYITLNAHISPDAKETDVFLPLLKDGPGRYTFDIAYGIAGFPVGKKNTVNIPDLEQCKDNATCLKTFDEDSFPFYFRSSPDATSLVISVVCTKSKTVTDYYTARLTSLSLKDNTLTPLSDGLYFEHYGILRDGRLFFLSRKTGRPDIWFSPWGTPTDKAALHTTNRTIKKHLDYSPNGRKLMMTAFQPTAPDHPQLHILNADTPYAPDLHVLCDGQNGAWSPLGNWVAFENGTPSRIFTITADGTHLTPIAPCQENYCDKDPAWSPDGKSIVFASNRTAPHAEDFDIWLYDLQKQTSRKVTSSSAIDDMPQFSPDGKTIIFRSNRNNQWGLWSVTP